ncbi:FKBP-type peptidyl-prolyl cis-trans isomerase [Denitratisoma oestradiolicum]|uniref:Peptidyl-prolyl cis-trans isomerase n=1 Tax=Denitratisoma oestradiolicum TaxID=311182 RepID=A0A6S6XVF2_9PROT|nr:FKBP-type peptidyl-prolyl cis-trans isomerase [Denitratisoma oestradiolicum]TWO79569.1 peptidylprolyl isomerase [Denitratisoma oestradiolicum]CAB1368037.1 Peptidyl-prolyl cis-trans isomerase [Denitratisoma oestradiolicum]
MAETVQADSFVTLHYRLSADDGLELMNTFRNAPGTLQMGSGQLAPSLEQRLIGVAEGERRVFELAAGEAFGARVDQLVVWVPKSQLPPKTEAEVHAQIDFVSANGQAYSGLVREVHDDAVLMDFNHPLAGKSVRFEVEVIGVL